MTPRLARASRSPLAQPRTFWRRIATAVALIAGCAALVACGGVEPTAAPYPNPLAAAADVATAAKPDASAHAWQLLVVQRGVEALTATPNDDLAI